MSERPAPVSDAPPRPVPGRDTRLPSPETAILIAALVVGSALILWAGRRLGFYFDEWMYIQYRHGNDLSTYLDPHNGHLSLIPIAIYKLLFATFGIDHYWPYRVVLLILHLVCCVLVYVLVRRRLGARAALVPVLLMVVMANSAENLIWAFQLDFVGSVAAGLGCWVLLDNPSRRNDIWVCVLVVVAVGFSALGIPVLIGVGVELLLRRSDWRRLWIVVIPGALFGLWYLIYGVSGQLRRDNLAIASQYVLDSAAGAAAAISGLSLAWGSVFLVGLGLAVAIVRYGNPRAPKPSPRLAGILVTALAFWGLTALSRGQLGEPEAPRYLYFGAVLTMMAVVWMVPRPRWTAWSMGVVAIVLAFVLVSDVYKLRDASRYLRNVWEPMQAQLAALEVAGADNVAPDYVPAQRTPHLLAGPYLDAVEKVDSPTGGPAWLRDAPEGRRQLADGTLAQVEGVAVQPAGGAPPAATGTPPLVETVARGRVSEAGSCQVLVPLPGDTAVLDLVVRPGEALSVTPARGPPVTVRARRYADVFTVEAGSVEGGRTGVLSTVADTIADVPWRAQVSAAQRTRICAIDNPRG